MFAPDPNRFLRTARGVVHVGANVGQERELYDRHGLDVLWIEPIPDVFATLAANIAGCPRQRALECLVTDRDDAPYEFNVANNGGESSSILALKEHRDVWPKVDFTKTITLRSSTLATLLARERIDLARYDALVMDTQGSELLVLRGAEPVLEQLSVHQDRGAGFRGVCRLRAARGHRAVSRKRAVMRSSHAIASRRRAGRRQLLRRRVRQVGVLWHAIHGHLPSRCREFQPDDSGDYQADARDPCQCRRLAE